MGKHVPETLTKKNKYGKTFNFIIKRYFGMPNKQKKIL